VYPQKIAAISPEFSGIRFEWREEYLPAMDDRLNLVALCAAVPAHIESVTFVKYLLCLYTGEELGNALARLPQIREIAFLQCHLGNLNVREPGSLSLALSRLENKGIKVLSLMGNGLGHIAVSTADIKQLLLTIATIGVTDLDISDCQIESEFIRQEKSIKGVISAIPKTIQIVRYFDLAQIIRYGHKVEVNGLYFNFDHMALCRYPAFNHAAIAYKSKGFLQALAGDKPATEVQVPAAHPKRSFLPYATMRKHLLPFLTPADSSRLARVCKPCLTS
jgi:hypothetical protein